MPAAPPNSYRAFISYSSVDRRLAVRLHVRLERYIFPPGTKTDSGTAPERLRPIFQDRLELRTGASLSETIRRALLESKALVVICSPNARISDWVNREIREFRSAHEDGMVMAFIVDGNPSAAPNDPQSCFPAALFDHGFLAPADSLASDARSAGDGWKLATLKLIAGLANVRLDDLVRRDQQRAIRRLRWVVAGSLAIALALAGLGTALYFQRKEAIRQRDLARHVRDRAQEMNTFFITDLRPKLRGIGRLDLLDATTQRVLAYQKALPAELASDPAVMRARAMAMDYAGQMAMARGQSDEAVSRLTDSREAWKTLLDKVPLDGAAWQGFTVSCRMLGEALEAAGRLAEASQAYLDGIANLSTLQAKTPEGIARYKRLRSILLTANGRARYRLGDSKTALSELDEAASSAKESVEEMPSERASWQQVVDAFDALADHYRRIGDLNAAGIQAQNAVQAGESLVKLDPENVDGWTCLANAKGVLLMIQTAHKRWDQAENTARDQLDLQRRIFERDPLNPTVESKLGAAHDDLAFALANGGKRKASIEHFAEAVRIFASLIERYPSRVGWRRDLALVFKRSGDVAFEVQEWDLALQDYEASLFLRQKLAAQAQDDITAQGELANIHIARGEVLWKQRNLVAAEKAFHDALGALQSLALPTNHPELVDLRQRAKAALDDFKQQEGR